ncbi:sensor histidine kinase [Polaribacter dokdonensis]|uniref:histidine kinase n=1 Tax=Polaribacter dokdonensis DSW-5 TaxID=1300348 RepID=A0A0N0UP17_9FLAO|nr:ATP-binding protein [Polaribacter dokdonensis]KOY53074.1 Two-component system sensor histidine kinase [Polaribacter dokdonensis DSW-5]SEE56821.1 His Kinase A (phospho-acceptor) domain-containing protein [Polaribacter dokdonensis DSW-5]
MKNNYKEQLEEFQQKYDKLLAENHDLSEKNAELKQFSHLASHDLQQPLNNIISYLSILENSKDKFDKMEQLSLKVISKSTLKMKSYITSLLDFSLIGTSKSKENIVVKEVLNDVKDALYQQISSTKAALSFDLTNHEMIGYKNDIYLLFLNLIENAVKFHSKEKSPVIQITSELKDDQYLYTIKDNGIGIPEDEVNKIFDIFYTIHPDEEFEGVGIGLAQAKKITKLYNGKIWLDAAPNKGAIFYVSFPAK